MGADLITIYMECPADQELNWDAGRERLANLAYEDVDWDVVEQLCIEPDLDDALDDAQYKSALVAAVREHVQDSFEEVAHILPSTQTRSATPRDVNILRIADRLVLLTGGMSWGDSPSETYEVIEQLYLIPGVLQAVGFITGAEPNTASES